MEIEVVGHFEELTTRLHCDSRFERLGLCHLPTAIEKSFSADGFDPEEIEEFLVGAVFGTEVPGVVKFSIFDEDEASVPPALFTEIESDHAVSLIWKLYRGACLGQIVQGFYKKSINLHFQHKL